MNINKLFILAVMLILLGCGSKSKQEINISDKPNFLIFIIDDLRPELGCYGETQIISPNIDQLAKEGLRFDRAYCNVPVCGASRASLLTGARPTHRRFLNYYARADVDLPDQITLPEYFKNKGYNTISYGKIFHDLDDSEESWSEPPWRAKPTYKNNWRDYISIENVSKDKKLQEPSTERALNAPDSAYIDGKVANAAVRKLQQLAKKDQPFMFWIGYVKPHLPFNAPSKYWDLYDREKIQIADNPTRPINAPDESIHNFDELRGYTDIPPEGPLSDEKASELIHGYSACVSYTDALIGQVLTELKRLELDENTIVVLFGDHGWNLGEHGLWCKHCNYNTSLHVPLIIKVPGKSQGKHTEGITEFVDLYPTFADLANIEVPEWTEGKSLVPLIKDPSLEWESPVYPRYQLGNSIVSKNFIYTEFMKSLKDTSIVANMLYDHRNDPDENNNIAGKKSLMQIADSLGRDMNKIHFK